MNGYLALICARVGENDLAIPLIERLLTTPGAVDSTDYSITVNDLKHRWEWDPIRNDPRFQKLIENDTPSEPNHRPIRLRLGKVSLKVPVANRGANTEACCQS